jgi:hypothetical protein
MDTRQTGPVRRARLAGLDLALKAMFAEAARSTPPDLLVLLHRLEPASKPKAAAA